MRRIALLLSVFTGIICVSGQPVTDSNAVKRVDSLKSVLTATTQPLERYKLLAAVGKTYYMTGNGDNSASNNLEMLRIALRLKDDSLIAVSYDYAGVYFVIERSDYNTAIDYMLKGIPYAEKSGNKRTICSIFSDLSLAYFAALNPKEEFKTLKEAEANLPDISQPDFSFLMLQIKLNYGLYYLSVRQPDSALTYLNAGIEVNRKLNLPAFDFFLKSLTGNAYQQLGDKDMAAVYFKKALAIDSVTVYPYAKVTFKKFYTGYLIESGRFPEAIIQSREILAIGEQSQDDVYKFIGVGYLKTIYDKELKIDSAYRYSKMESALRDTIYSQERLNKAQALAFNEETRLADEQNKLAEEQRLRREDIQYAVIALCIMVLLSLYLLLSRSFITNAKWIEFFGVVVLLIVFEFLNLLLHPFLERVTSHSPVLMLLSLVCIAALLVPLHHKAEKLAIAKLVEKNKQIRLAAAKKTIRELDTSSTGQ